MERRSTGHLIDNLSKEQQKAVLERAKHTCILATPGSGKTRTLVHAVAYDLAQGVPANGIVAFTFTEKAAEELTARVYALAKTHFPDVDLSGIYIGTIHAWCLQYLLDQPEFYNVTPLDELQTDALVSRMYDFLGLSEAYGLRFPIGVSKFVTDLEIVYNEHLELSNAPQRIRPSLERFMEVLEENRLLTFGGMVRSAVEHLRTNGPLVDLRAVYVDEYQDVNPAQVALIKAMLPPEAKLVVVGDDLQCIYNWRGSDVGRILNFGQDFSETIVHRVSTNYRSRPGVVRLANGLAKAMARRDPEKEMVPSRPALEGRNVYWIRTQDAEDEAETAAEIVEQLAQRGFAWDRMAVLLRSVRLSGEPIIRALRQRGIPVHCPDLSQGDRFLDEFLSPVVAWLIREHTEPRNAAEESELESEMELLWSKASNWVPPSSGPDDFWDALHRWYDAINSRRADAYNVRKMLYDFLDSCDVRVGQTDEDLMVGLSLASQIIRSVEEVHRHRIAGHPRRPPRSVMKEIHFALERQRRYFGEGNAIGTTSKGVFVGTVHKAKGLEWPVVIVPSLMQGLFPVRARGHDSSFPDEIAQRYGTSLDDERRLFYVATTRAMERLFLMDHAQMNDRDCSVFLEELADEGLVSPIDPHQIPSEAWDLSEKELKDPDVPPLRVGISDLLLYVDCPYEYGLRRVAGIQPAIGDELGFGKSLHELIQRRLESGKTWNSFELRDHSKAHVRLPYMSRGAEDRVRQTLVRDLEVLERTGVLSGESQVEIPVEVLFDEGIVYGKIDHLGVRGDSVVVRDWKSNVHKEFLPRYVRQLQFYALALVQQGTRVGGAEIVDIGATADEQELVVHEVNIDPQAASDLLAELSSALRGIAAERFDATPGPDPCGRCDMYMICGERYSGEPNGRR